MYKYRKRNIMISVQRNSESITPFVSAKNSILSGWSTGFPSELKANDSVIITIYDSDLVKAVQSMMDGAQGVIDKMKKAFEGGGGGGGMGRSMGSDTQQNVKKAEQAMLTSATSGFSMPSFDLAGLDGGNGNTAPRTLAGTIKLPVPNNIQESLQHSYDEEGGWVDDIVKALGGETVQNLISAGTKAAAVVSKKTGARSYTYDQNRIAMYKTSAFRQITLQWTLVPNNKEDTQKIKDIVKTFKKYSSPQSVAKKTLLRSPHFFKLVFPNEYLDKSLQFWDVVVTDISVEYNPGGSMEMTYDKAPKAVNLSVTFKDREPKLYEDWSDTPKIPETPGETKCS